MTKTEGYKILRHKGRIRSLYCKQQLSANAIGEMCKVDKTMVRYYLKKHGIPIRGLKEAGKLRTAKRLARSGKLRQPAISSRQTGRASKLVWVRIPPNKLHLFKLV